MTSSTLGAIACPLAHAQAAVHHHVQIHVIPGSSTVTKILLLEPIILGRLLIDAEYISTWVTEDGGNLRRLHP